MSRTPREIAEDIVCYAAVNDESVVELARAFIILDDGINTPGTTDFIQALTTEAAHQRVRWGVEHDAGKKDSDWYWLLGYLGGKVLHPEIAQDKKLHRIVAIAAAAANWHAHYLHQTDMRPGIDYKSVWEEQCPK